MNNLIEANKMKHRNICKPFAFKTLAGGGDYYLWFERWLVSESTPNTSSLSLSLSIVRVYRQLQMLRTRFQNHSPDRPNTQLLRLGWNESSRCGCIRRLCRNWWNVNSVRFIAEYQTETLRWLGMR